jgi:hypothetical protein
MTFGEWRRLGIVPALGGPGDSEMALLEPTAGTDLSPHHTITARSSI